MPIPHPERAIVDLRKLVSYCLNPDHSRGRHKARVLRRTLGIGPEQAEWLRERLLDGIVRHDAVMQFRDAFGDHYRVDIPLSKDRRIHTLRSLWIVRAGENFPRFVSCYVL